jgi:hypothetical protein
MNQLYIMNVQKSGFCMDTFANNNKQWIFLYFSANLIDNIFYLLNQFSLNL